MLPPTEAFLESIQDVCFTVTTGEKILQTNGLAKRLFHFPPVTGDQEVNGEVLSPNFWNRFRKERSLSAGLCHSLRFTYQDIPTSATRSVVGFPYQSGHIMFIQKTRSAKPLPNAVVKQILTLLAKPFVLNRTLPAIMEKIQEVFGCDSVALCLFERKKWFIKSGCHLPSGWNGAAGKCHEISELFEKSIQAGVPCILDAGQLPAQNRSATGPSVEHSLFVPFQLGQVTYGAFLFNYHEPDSLFSEQQVMMGREIAAAWGLILYHKIVQFQQKRSARKVKNYQRRLRNWIHGEKAKRFDLDLLLKRVKIADHNFYRAFYTNPCLMLMIDLNGRILAVNDQFIRATDFEEQEIVGQTLTSITLCSNEILQRLRDVFWQRGRIAGQKIRFVGKNKESHSAVINVEVIRREGKRILLVQAEDITNEEHLEQEMCRLDRLNLVGQLAASISHEVRNPMTTVRGFLQMLLRKDECQKYRKFFELMILELDRANSLINEFLSMARNRPAHFLEQNLNEIIRSLEPLLYAQAMNLGMNLKVELGSIPLIWVNSKEIRQLLLNLVGNAFDAMNPGKTVTVTTCFQEGQVQLMVADEGPGIPDEVMKKIGTPFFTTKEKGTGLGLTVCFQIAERHKALLKIDSASTGTKFTIAFRPSSAVEPPSGQTPK